MQFIPTKQNTGLGELWNFDSINLGSFDFGQVDYSKIDYSKVDFAAEPDKNYQSVFTQNMPNIKTDTVQWYNGVAEMLIAEIKRLESEGTEFEKDYKKPELEEILECYRRSNEKNYHQNCGDIGNKWIKIRAEVRDQAEAKNDFELAKLYNEKAAEEKKGNKKMLIIGGVVLGTLAIATTIYLVNQE